MRRLCVAASVPDACGLCQLRKEQQGVLALHSARTLLGSKQQTMLVNAMRGLAAEFGVIVPKGVSKIDQLHELVAEEPTIPPTAQQAFGELNEHRIQGTHRIAELETKIVEHARTNNMAPGLGLRFRALA